MITRRSMLLGLTAALAAPAIVKAENLMKIWVSKPDRIILDDPWLVDPPEELWGYSNLLCPNGTFWVKVWMDKKTGIVRQTAIDPIDIYVHGIEEFEIAMPAVFNEDGLRIA